MHSRILRRVPPVGAIKDPAARRLHLPIRNVFTVSSRIKTVQSVSSLFRVFGGSESSRTSRNESLGLDGGSRRPWTWETMKSKPQPLVRRGRKGDFGWQR